MSNYNGETTLGIDCNWEFFCVSYSSIVGFPFSLKLVGRTKSAPQVGAVPSTENEDNDTHFSLSDLWSMDEKCNLRF